MAKSHGKPRNAATKSAASRGQAEVVPAGDGRVGLAKYDVSPELFCKVWTEAKSADEVADKLGMPKPIVHARASSYREKGIPLKKMPRHARTGLDVDALRQLVEALNQEHGVEGTADRDDEAPGRAVLAKKAGVESVDPDAVKAIVEQVLKARGVSPTAKK